MTNIIGYHNGMRINDEIIDSQIHGPIDIEGIICIDGNCRNKIIVKQQIGDLGFHRKHSVYELDYPKVVQPNQNKNSTSFRAD